MPRPALLNVKNNWDEVAFPPRDVLFAHPFPPSRPKWSNCQVFFCVLRLNRCVFLKEGGFRRRLVRYCPPFQLFFFFACTGSHFWLMPSVPLSFLFLHLLNWTNFWRAKNWHSVLHCVIVFRWRMVKPYDEIFTLGKPPMYIPMYPGNWCPIPKGEYVTGACVIPGIPW